MLLLRGGHFEQTYLPQVVQKSRDIRVVCGRTKALTKNGNDLLETVAAIATLPNQGSGGIEFVGNTGQRIKDNDSSIH